MKKIVKVCICMACMVCIVACGKEKTKTPEEMVGQTVNEEIESGKPAGMDIVTEVAAYVSVTASQEYQFGKDQQTWFSGMLQDIDCAESEESVYFFVRHKIYVFDKEKKTLSVLCNKPDCKHEMYNMECNAEINTGSSLEYYDGYLYFLNFESQKEDGVNQNYIKLYRLSLDGSVREEVSTVATAHNVANATTNTFCVNAAAIHRGYLYYIYTFGSSVENEDSYYVNGSNTLYRISLEKGSTPECVCPMDFQGSTSCDIQGVGSYVYFLKSGLQEDVYVQTLCRLNLENNKIEQLNLGNIDSYCALKDKVIYLDAKTQKYYAYYVADHTVSVVYEKEADDELSVGYQVWDSKYLNTYRFSNEVGNMFVCTENMDVVFEYSTKEFGGSFGECITLDYNFYLVDDNEMFYCYYLDKRNLSEDTKLDVVYLND